MNITIQRSNHYGTLTPDRLQAMERGLGEELPAEYREFLLNHNGGVPDPDCFTVLGDEEYNGEPSERQLACFFAAHDQTWSDKTPEGSLGHPLQKAWRDFADDVPGSQAVPVGKDWSGNYICIGYTGESKGRMYFYDHEYEELRPLSESFGAFLNTLNPCEEA